MHGSELRDRSPVPREGVTPLGFAARMTFVTGPLIVTDGFEFYGTVIRRVFGPAALYAQVIKTRRHDRVVRVDRRAVIGAALAI